MFNRLLKRNDCLSFQARPKRNRAEEEKKKSSSAPTPCGAPKIKNPHNHLLPVTHLENLYKSTTTTERERRGESERGGHLPTAKNLFAQRLQGEIFRA